MKTKIVNLLGAALLLGVMISCEVTSISEDKQMLQKHYDVVYQVNEYRYITIDSLGKVYDIRVTANGSIKSTIEIR